MSLPQNVADSLAGVFADKDADSQAAQDLAKSQAALAQAQHDLDLATTTKSGTAITLQRDFDASVALLRDAVFNSGAAIPPPAPAVAK